MLCTKKENYVLYFISVVSPILFSDAAEVLCRCVPAVYNAGQAAVDHTAACAHVCTPRTNAHRHSTENHRERRKVGDNDDLFTVKEF